MASNSEYEQRRCFEDKKLKRIDGGVDGRKTWKLSGMKYYDEKQQWDEEYNKALNKAIENFINSKI